MEGILLPENSNFLFFVFSNALSFLIASLLRHLKIVSLMERISGVALSVLSFYMLYAKSSTNFVLTLMGIFASFAMIVSVKSLKELDSPELGAILAMVCGNSLLSLMEFLPIPKNFKLIALTSAMVGFFLLV